MLLICSFIVTLLTALFFICAARDHAQQYDHAKPQRFHVGDVRRVGGAAILSGVHQDGLLPCPPAIWEAVLTLK